MNQATIDPIVCHVVVDTPAELAFRCFTDRFGEWWPQDYTFSKQSLSGMYLGRAVGQWCYEQGPHGFRCDWGRILEWIPPSGLGLTWQIGPKSIIQPDPEQCTEVRVRFADEIPGRSRVTLTHQYFERHGAEGAAYRSDMASDYGWPFILKRFAGAARA